MIAVRQHRCSCDFSLVINVERVDDLEVRRASLEDAYIALVRASEEGRRVGAVSALMGKVKETSR